MKSRQVGRETGGVEVKAEIGMGGRMEERTEGGRERERGGGIETDWKQKYILRDRERERGGERETDRQTERER